MYVRRRPHENLLQFEALAFCWRQNFLIAEQFAPIEIECLVKTAVDLWLGAELSTRQRDVLARASAAAEAEHPGPPAATAVLESPPAASVFDDSGDTSPTCNLLDELLQAADYRQSLAIKEAALAAGAASQETTEVDALEA